MRAGKQTAAPERCALWSRLVLIVRPVWAHTIGQSVTEKLRPHWTTSPGSSRSRLSEVGFVLACGGRAWHEVAFEYPTQSQGSISEFVSRAAKAVQNSEDQGGGFGLSYCRCSPCAGSSQCTVVKL